MARELTTQQMIERSVIKRFRRGIWNKFVMGIKEYKMLSSGDKIAVCVSGGKDSAVLAKCMQHLQKYSDMKFDLEFIAVNMGYNENTLKKLKSNSELMGIPVKIFDENIFEKVKNSDSDYCIICENLRTDSLLKIAKSLGCNKIALGHHFDDVIENILMEMLYNGRIQSIMPKLHSENYEGMEIIRPLYMVKEPEIIDWVKYNDLELLGHPGCGGAICTNAEIDKECSRRIQMKELIKRFRATNDNIEFNIFKSVYNVNLRTLVACEKNGERHSFLDTYNDFKWTEPDGDSEEDFDE